MTRVPLFRLTGLDWTLAAAGLLFLASPASRGAEPKRPAELWVLNAQKLSPAEQTLAATLQGVLNREKATVWTRAEGMSAVVLGQLRDEGVVLHDEDSPWPLLERFRDQVAGAVVYQQGTESLNVATSLCGLRRGVAVEASLLDRAKSAGLKVLADARGRTEAQTLTAVGSQFARGLLIHQPPDKFFHLRDFAVARRAFTFATEDADRRTRTVQAFGPLPFVLGWGQDEKSFVSQVSEGGGAVIAADWSVNLSALQHLPADIPNRRVPDPAPPKRGERVVAFVMSDGDNIQWMAGPFVTDRGFWTSPQRGHVTMTWEMAPILADVAPRALAYFYRQASTGDFLDDFVTGPSGAGYFFPHLSPANSAWALKTAERLRRSRMSVVSVLNDGGDMAETAPLLERSEVEGVIYKDYDPYNKQRGAIFWHAGKPCVSYRYLLWEPAVANSPEGVAAAIAAQPAEADTNPDSYALVNVHAWSFRSLGGPMEAVRRTVDRLPPNTRVVTATQLIRLLRGVAAPKKR